MRETVFLNNDREMPLLGLGVYKTADNEAETAINAAVDAGYRLIDTASARIFSSQARSGTMHSVSGMWTELFTEALRD